MTLVVISGRMLVAVILIAAGAAKLADLRSFRATLAGLGLPLPRVLPPLIAGLELGAGVVSLTSAWPRATDVAVVALTLAFAGVAGFAMRRAPSLRCRCFGALSNARFGRGALVRSLLLAAIALAVLLANLHLDTQAAWSALPLTVLLSSVLAFAVAAGQAARAIEVAQEGEAA